jgi:phospholipid/cholesterol/gamma-HCH transport system ATP-binding protein
MSAIRHQPSLEPVIEVSGLVTRFGDAVIHDNIDLTVYRGEVLALVGGSGCGKTTLLREVMMLQRPAAGSIRVLGREVVGLSDLGALELRRRSGVMFQHGALFSGMTLQENVGAPLREFTDLDDNFIDEVAAIKIALVGLPADACAKYPNEISGGMRKRAAMARAIALDPELVFLDEPTAGLDPVAAAGIDELVLKLKRLLGLTIIIVTHDLDTLWRVVDRVVMLGERKVLAMGGMDEVSRAGHPLIREYFHGPRGRTAQRHGK